MPWTRSTNLKGPSMLRLARLPAALSTDSDASWLALFTTPLAAQQVLSFSAELYFSSDANKAGLVTTLTGPDAGLIQSVSQVLWPELPAWGLFGGIAPSLCPKPPLPQLILI